jgi:protein-L-isoaspartate(D-aspartate) O-methyltransferase
MLRSKPDTYAAVVAAALSCGTVAHAQSSFDAERAALVAEIERRVQATRLTTGKDRLAEPVMTAIATVPRHEFVPSRFRGAAYSNEPLPIGEGQTISQPYVVALMTDLAEVGADSVVLEVGTGSGYQAAVLAEIVAHVYTIEIIEPLAVTAAETLRRLGYDNVVVKAGDGYLGWPEHAPFDAIIVTAAPEEIPPPLIEQLRPGGRMVVPVGPQDYQQSLRVLAKDEAGKVTTTEVLPVVFVPLTRD